MAILIGHVTLERLLIFILALIATIVVGNVAYMILRRSLDNRITPRRSKLFAKSVEYTIFLLGIYLGIYYVLELDLTALGASLGLLGIAVAFSSQQIIQNFVGGLLLAVERPLQLEDWVEVGLSGICKVRDVTLIHTILRDRTGRILYVPNSVVLSSTIVNYSHSGFVEVPMQFGFPVGCDCDKVKTAILHEVKADVNVLPNVPKNEKAETVHLLRVQHLKKLFEGTPDLNNFGPRVYVSEVTETKITVSLRFWIREIQKRDQITANLMERILKRLKSERVLPIN